MSDRRRQHLLRLSAALDEERRSLSFVLTAQLFHPLGSLIITTCSVASGADSMRMHAISGVRGSTSFTVKVANSPASRQSDTTSARVPSISLDNHARTQTFELAGP